MKTYPLGFVADVCYGRGELGPGLVTARHWAHGEFEIVVRSLQDEEQVVVLDRSVIAAVNRLLRAQPALPMPGYEPPDEAAQVVVAAGEAWPAETGCYEYPILGSSVGSSGGAM
jgi:hypothetical protein